MALNVTHSVHVARVSGAMPSTASSSLWPISGKEGTFPTDHSGPSSGKVNRGCLRFLCHPPLLILLLLFRRRRCLARAVHRRFPSIYWPIRTVSRRALAEIHRRLSPRSAGDRPSVRPSVRPDEEEEEGDDGPHRRAGDGRNVNGDPRRRGRLTVSALGKAEERGRRRRRRRPRRLSRNKTTVKSARFAAAVSVRPSVCPRPPPSERCWGRGRGRRSISAPLPLSRSPSLPLPLAPIRYRLRSPPNLSHPVRSSRR